MTTQEKRPTLMIIMKIFTNTKHPHNKPKTTERASVRQNNAGETTWHDQANSRSANSCYKNSNFFGCMSKKVIPKFPSFSSSRQPIKKLKKLEMIQEIPAFYPTIQRINIAWTFNNCHVFSTAKSWRLTVSSTYNYLQLTYSLYLQ